MRDPARIDPIIEELSRYWKRNPDLRLGQIIGNCARGTDPYYIEDDRLLAELQAGWGRGGSTTQPHTPTDR